MLNRINGFITGVMAIINQTTTLVIKLAVIGLLFMLEQWAEKP